MSSFVQNKEIPPLIRAGFQKLLYKGLSINYVTLRFKRRLTVTIHCVVSLTVLLTVPFGLHLRFS